MKALRQIRNLRALCFFSVAAITLLLVACATQPAPEEAYGLPGFFSGLLHGFLIVFSFIGSLFTDVRIYNFPNAGRWYDFGYVIGAMIFLGGSGASAS